MAAIGTLPVLFATGNHAGRPAASAVGKGGLYSCTTHSLVYQTDGSSWSTWATLGSTGSVATDTIFDAKGDLPAGTGADTAAKLTVGANDTILMADSGQATGLKWVASQTPSTQAFSDAAAEGTADTYARGDHKHAMPASPGGGSDLVQVASGAGNVVIPGIAVPDRVPASPGAFDDEFDTTSTFSSTLGSLDSNNVTDAASHLHLAKTATGGQALFGVYKTAPSFPFTMTAKLADFRRTAIYQAYYLMLGVTSPGALFCFGITQSGAGAESTIEFEYGSWASSTSRSSVTSSGIFMMQGQVYLRIVATSTSSVALSFSQNGLVWHQLYTGVNPGITITKAGLVVGSATNSVTADAMFDWVRFT